MQIYYKINNNTKVIDIEESDTIFSFALKVSEKENVHPLMYRMTYCGKQLQLDQTLQYYNISDQSSINLFGRLVFGQMIVKKSGEWVPNIYRCCLQKEKEKYPNLIYTVQDLINQLQIDLGKSSTKIYNLSFKNKRLEENQILWKLAEKNELMITIKVDI